MQHLGEKKIASHQAHVKGLLNLVTGPACLGLLVAISLLSLGLSANARPPSANTQLQTVSSDFNSANGRCLPVKEVSDSVLSEYGIKMQSKNSGDEAKARLALKRVIGTIKKISGGHFRHHMKADFYFGYYEGVSRQGYNNQSSWKKNCRTCIWINRQADVDKMENHGEIAHELCHHIAHRAGPAGGYHAYSRAVASKGSCFPSSYAKARRHKHNHEEYSEVCAAYITNPSLLANQDTEACRAAMEFMRRLFKEDNVATSCLDRRDGLPTATPLMVATQERSPPPRQEPKVAAPAHPIKPVVPRMIQEPHGVVGTIGGLIGVFPQLIQAVLPKPPNSSEPLVPPNPRSSPYKDVIQRLSEQKETLNNFATPPSQPQSISNGCGPGQGVCNTSN